MTTANRTAASFIGELCLFEIAFYFAYKYGMSFSHAFASPFWFPDSVLLCTFLLTPPKRWWIFALAQLPIRLFLIVPPHVPWWFTPTTAAIDAAKGLAAAALLRRFLKNPIRMDTVREFSLFCLFAVVLAPAISAFAGAGARHALGEGYWSTWEQWFLGNVVTQLVVTPAILYWIWGGPPSRPSFTMKRWLEAAGVTVGMILAGHLAFGTETGGMGFAEARFYAPVPLLFWAAVRFGMVGASGAIMLLAYMSVYAALAGVGPFSGQSPRDTALALQRFLLLRAAPLYLVAVLIEQMKGTQKSLQESEERMSLAVRAGRLGMWLWDLTRDTVWATPENRALFGWTSTESVNLDRFMDSLHPEDREATRRAMMHALQDGDFVMEFRVPAEGEKIRWVSTRGRVEFNAQGTPLRLRGVAIDVTDRKKAELELRQNRDALAHVARISAMGELAASLAHELSQPLTAILNNTQAAQRFLAPERLDINEVRVILKDIAQDDTRASNVIRRMRSLLKKEKLSFAPVDLMEVMDEVVTLLHSDAVMRNVRVSPAFNEGIPPVEGDKIQLQQVALNLLSNAFEAMKQCAADGREVVIGARINDAQMVEISVRDRGAGLTTEELEKIFEPFYTTKREGLGMGLSISRSIIEAHGGRLWAQNNADEGATFYFTLPVVKTEAGLLSAMSPS